MATVSSIDNQLPLLQANSENSTAPDNEAVMPFGQWLDQKSEVKDDPKPMQLKHKEEAETNRMKTESEPQKSTKLIDENDTEKSKDSGKLFKEQPAVTQRGVRKATSEKAPAEADSTQAAKKPKYEKSGSSTTSGVAASRSAAFKSTTAESRMLFAKDVPHIDKQNTASKVAAQTPSIVQNFKNTASGLSVKNNKAQNSAGLNKAELKIPGQNITGQNITGQKITGQNIARQNIARGENAEALMQLKTNVKAIFNSLTPLKSTPSSDSPEVRLTSQPGGNARTVSVDKVKPIRLTTMPAAQPFTRQDGKTTLQHLQARKSAGLDTKLTLEKENVPDSKNELVKDAVGKLDSKNGLIHADADAGAASRKKGPNARTRKNARKTQAAAVNKNQGYQSATPEGFKAIPKETDFAQDGNLLQSSSNQSNSADFIQLDGASPDSNHNNLLGKDQAGLNVSAGKSAGKATPAYATRSAAWMKSLSERTANMNRHDPNWKILEMKLDHGDGKMTVKVMRENEHVAISVQFTDEALRTHTESQSSQIMDSLKEQYGEDVTFTFADHQESTFDSSFRDQAARRRRVSPKLSGNEQPIPVSPQTFHTPDQHLWIG